eukprot:CAMPEP_0174234844 /NCGR_PEP_ID=MMETSP0417-20130205/4483_1 /TAXON_ID=242541 /ORGANISM="Mayorella sp, Strain BSH-02190019" /LENGTH=453 /DNA_ID=CAMNT_0015313265 /DNA_START=116 /DNA_END=1474 /DNA_ORIENTATION=-
MSTDFLPQTGNTATLRRTVRNTHIAVNSKKEGIVEFTTCSSASVKLWPTRASLSFNLKESSSVLSRLSQSTARHSKSVRDFIDAIEELDLRNCSPTTAHSSEGQSRRRHRTSVSRANRDLLSTRLAIANGDLFSAVASTSTEGVSSAPAETAAEVESSIPEMPSLKDFVETSLLKLDDPRQAIQVLTAVGTVGTVSDRISNHCLRLLHHVPAWERSTLIAELAAINQQCADQVLALIEEREQHFPRCEALGSNLSTSRSSHLRREDSESLVLATKVVVHIPLISSAAESAHHRQTDTMNRIAMIIDSAQRTHAVTPGPDDGSWGSRAKKLVTFSMLDITSETLYPPEVTKKMYLRCVAKAEKAARSLGLEVAGLAQLNVEGKLENSKRFGLEKIHRTFLHCQTYMPLEWHITLTANYYLRPSGSPLPAGLVLIRDPDALLAVSTEWDDDDESI